MQNQSRESPTSSSTNEKIHGRISFTTHDARNARMAALVNAALSSRLAIADRRSLRRGPVAPAPRAANLVVKAGWFDNNKDVDGRDPMWEQQQEILKRRRKGGNLESEVNKRRAKVSGFMKGTLDKEEMDAIKAKNKAKADDLAKEAFKGQKGWISLPGMAVGMPEFDGGERFDLRAPYADEGWVDENDKGGGFLGGLFGGKKKEEKNSPPPKPKKKGLFGR